MEPQDKIDVDALMSQARQMRAEAIAEMSRSLIAFFRRKPLGSAVKV